MNKPKPNMIIIKHFFVYFQQSSPIRRITTSAGFLFIAATAAAFSPEAEPNAVKQCPLHTRDACAQTALPQVTTHLKYLKEAPVFMLH